MSLRKSTGPSRKRIPLQKKTAQQLIKVADQYFSKYVRLRDTEFRGDGWYGTCVTCSKSGIVAWIDSLGKLHFVIDWDAGHFMSRGHKVVRYDEENVNLQCLTGASNLYLVGGGIKNIKDVGPGDEVMAFDETGLTPLPATVLGNVAFTSRTLYEVILEDGTVFCGTGDHRVLCDVDGKISWQFLEDVNNMLHEGIVCNIITL